MKEFSTLTVTTPGGMITADGVMFRGEPEMTYYHGNDRDPVRYDVGPAGELNLSYIDRAAWERRTKTYAPGQWLTVDGTPAR